MDKIVLLVNFALFMLPVVMIGIAVVAILAAGIYAIRAVSPSIEREQEWVNPYKHAPCRSSSDNGDDCPDDDKPQVDPYRAQRYAGYLIATHQLPPNHIGHPRY